MNYYDQDFIEEEVYEEQTFDTLELDFPYLESTFDRMKTYCQHNGLDLLTSREAFTEFIYLATG